MNLKTVIWAFGLTSLILDLFALANLDFLNVLLLLPSLLFTVSILAGPFLLKPRAGQSLGMFALIPRICGWISSFLIYTAISLWLPHRGILHWAGLFLLAAVAIALLSAGLRYSTYHFRLRRRTAALARSLAVSGLDPAKAHEIARQVVAQAANDHSATEQVLARSGLNENGKASALHFVQEKLVPLLRKPVVDVRSGRFANNRWLSEFSRSLVLSLLVFLWLFVVPVPGLFVFTAGDYRVSLGLGNVVGLIAKIIGLALLGSWIGGWIQKVDASGTGKLALRNRFVRAFAELRERLRSSTAPSGPELASTLALFTDLQTYMDQRSYAYARKVLADVESKLRSKS